MFMKSERLWPIEHQPVYTAKLQEAQVECPFMDSSFSSATMKNIRNRKSNFIY
jgi:hypothetical protein